MSERNKILPVSVFYLVFVSRIVVCLTSVHSASLGIVKTDILVSLVLSLGLTLLLSLPVLYCYKLGKNPFEIKWLSYLYFAYFVYSTSVYISRFSYFASTALNPNSQAWIYVAIFCLCAFYCACLGIEALSRFSAFVFALMLIGVITLAAGNIKAFQEINLYPVINNSASDIIKSAVIMSSNTSEIIAFLCIGTRVNGNAQRHFIRGITGAYLTIFVLILFMIGTMGNAVEFQSFPLYTLFQISKLTSFERLDVLHISFWIFAVFVKTVLFIYCASISVKGFSNRKKSALASASAFAVSLLLLNTGTSGNLEPNYVIVPFFIFCVIIPFATLIFKKRSSAGELIKKF